MPVRNAPAVARRACSRRGASAYGSLDVRGATIGAAARSAPAGVDTAAGDPVAVPIEPKLWNVVDWKTADTVWRSALSCCGLARCDCGPVELLQAAASAAMSPSAQRR